MLSQPVLLSHIVIMKYFSKYVCICHDEIFCFLLFINPRPGFQALKLMDIFAQFLKRADESFKNSYERKLNSVWKEGSRRPTECSCLYHISLLLTFGNLTTCLCKASLFVKDNVLHKFYNLYWALWWKLQLNCKVFLLKFVHSWKPIRLS